MGIFHNLWITQLWSLFEEILYNLRNKCRINLTREGNLERNKHVAKVEIFRKENLICEAFMGALGETLD